MATMTRRREQKPKGSRRSPEQQRAILDLRQGSRTTPVPSGTRYKRTKSVNRRHWKDED